MINLQEAVTLVKSRQSVIPGSREELSLIRVFLNQKYPNTVKAIKLIDVQYSKKREVKGYNLVKRENKEHGFLYYVRYSHEGKMLPSKWNTHTNNFEQARQFAMNNKERIVSDYLQNHDSTVFNIFLNFYKKDSDYLKKEANRRHKMTERSRYYFNSVITNSFVPYLKKRGIKSVNGINVELLSDYQDYLLSEGGSLSKGGLMPQTANKYLGAIKRMFLYLIRKNMVSDNPFTALERLTVGEDDQTVRGCYELEKLKGVFNTQWSKIKHYILCLLIYSTGMRNSEIERLKMSDIIKIDDCNFIDIQKSKTPGGVRLVPLHDKVLNALRLYAKGKSKDELVFNYSTSSVYNSANAALARQLQVSEEILKEQNITFYSGRHFWKTLMNSAGLGDDIEEVFMGHHVSNDVAKRYNHRDKQGRERVIAKAKQVFAILDEKLF